jgi:hypothetical protein
MATPRFLILLEPMANHLQEWLHHTDWHVCLFVQTVKLPVLCCVQYSFCPPSRCFGYDHHQKRNRKYSCRVFFLFSQQGYRLACLNILLQNETIRHLKITYC